MFLWQGDPPRRLELTECRLGLRMGRAERNQFRDRFASIGNQNPLTSPDPSQIVPESCLQLAGADNN